MQNNILSRISSIILYIFHPLVIILYFIIILLFASSLSNNTTITLDFKLSIIAHISAFTIFIPITLMFMFQYCEKKFNLTIFRNNQVLLNLLLTAICYLIAMFSSTPYLGAMIAKKIFLTSAIVMTFTNILMLFFPISLHLLAISMMTILLAAAHLLGYGNLEIYVAIFVIIAGLTASCQLFREDFTLIQTFYSYLIGSIGMGILLFI